MVTMNYYLSAFKASRRDISVREKYSYKIFIINILVIQVCRRSTSERQLRWVLDRKGQTDCLIGGAEPTVGTVTLVLWLAAEDGHHI